jgi:signal transduction histidine kinase
MELMNLPVRLVVPEIPGGASAAAWRDVRGTLVTSWAAGLAVLVIAGWGLRNLVALTERRMQFAYAVTHELRTPLTTFRLYSDMLSAGLVPDAARQEYLDTLNTESQRLSSLVEEVLEYARLENHKVKLNPADTDGASLLGLISETLEERCEANGIEAVTENTLADGQRVRTDVDLVNRIAGVLVNNACRHVRGRDSARVLVRLGGQDERIQIDVVDSGPGIERADSRAIFKPFRRGRGEAAAPGGVGLGLALARGWAKLLGGRLELTARHDARFGGAHFRLTIPTQRPK